MKGDYATGKRHKANQVLRDSPSFICLFDWEGHLGYLEARSSNIVVMIIIITDRNLYLPSLTFCQFIYALVGMWCIIGQVAASVSPINQYIMFFLHTPLNQYQKYMLLLSQ